MGSLEGTRDGLLEFDHHQNLSRVNLDYSGPVLFCGWQTAVPQPTAICHNSPYVTVNHYFYLSSLFSSTFYILSPHLPHIPITYHNSTTPHHNSTTPHHTIPQRSEEHTSEL